ncbi:MAG: MGDG synthase family glycosyltransferase [Terriglobia bacterium]
MHRILILTTSHGASHRRASEALKKAFLSLQADLNVEIADAIEHCARWFRIYYDSYTIPLRYWPSLWRWIESRQHRSASTTPGWLYRLGGRPLFRHLGRFAPDVVIATEVGVCELAALHKRQARARYFLVGLELMDFNLAWVQPEVDLYPVVHADLGEELAAAGAPRAKILDCGMPIDLVYANLPNRAEVRSRLDLDGDIPILLVLFGGTGFGDTRRIVAELGKVQTPFQVVFIAGKNAALAAQLQRLIRQMPARPTGQLGPKWPEWRVLGWVNNMQDWMAAADLLLSKPGGGTVMEAAACGLPLLAFDPLPGNEERICRWLEKWQVGIWVQSSSEIAPVVERLLADAGERSRLRDRASSIARPRAALAAAAAILDRASRAHGAP